MQRFHWWYLNNNGANNEDRTDDGTNNNIEIEDQDQDWDQDWDYHDHSTSNYDYNLHSNRLRYFVWPVRRTNLDRSYLLPVWNLQEQRLVLLAVRSCIVSTVRLTYHSKLRHVLEKCNALPYFSAMALSSTSANAACSPRISANSTPLNYAKHENDGVSLQELMIEVIILTEVQSATLHRSLIISVRNQSTSIHSEMVSRKSTIRNHEGRSYSECSCEHLLQRQ